MLISSLQPTISLASTVEPCMLQEWGSCLMVLIYSLSDGELKDLPRGQLWAGCPVSQNIMACHELLYIVTSSPAFMFYLKSCLVQRALLTHWVWSASALPSPPRLLFLFLSFRPLSPPLSAAVFDHFGVVHVQMYFQMHEDVFQQFHSKQGNGKTA